MPFQIIRNDITKVKADAIVNTANPDPVPGGGTDSAIYKAAGEEALLAERKKIGKLKAGQAAVTPAFGLDAKYIIHTVGPVWRGGRHFEARKLRQCYRNSLRLARDKGCESIAFPLISTGVYGFPKESALKIAISEIGNFLSENEMLICLTVFDRESFELSGKLSAEIDSYIDEHYVSDRLEEEYSVDEKRPAVTERNVGFGLCDNPPSCPMAAPLPLMRCSTPPEKSGKKCKSQKSMRFNVDKDSVSSIPECSPEEVTFQLGETFRERLFRLIDERGMTDVEVYRKANLDRKLFSKIRCNADYRPKKATALALAVALKLNLDETKDLLSRAEMALSPANKFDLIITYFMEREVYDIYTINLALFQHNQPMLGC